MEYMNVMVKVIMQFYVINKEWEVNEKKKKKTVIWYFACANINDLMK